MLEIKNVTKKFDTSTPYEKIALDNFSLKVEKGDFITVLGSNGAGKSSLFNAILGKFCVDNGQIILDDEDITNKKDYKRAFDIGCIYQNPLRGTAPNMTIEENLALAFTRKASKSFFAVNKKDTAYFKEILASLGLGLEDRMKAKMGTLSGGQRQAASLIMSTITSPKLLLLDEHTAALDPNTAELVLKTTRKIVEEKNITAIMITHNMAQALQCGNRTIMMDSGRLIYDISGEERSKTTPQKLIELFAQNAKQALTDRMLLN